MSTPSQDHPRMDTVYQESPNTPILGAAYMYMYAYPILGSSQDGYSILGIPEYSDRGGSLCIPHPRIIPGWIQYARNPRILQQREQLMSTPSQDHPGMDTVYQESLNTLTEGPAYMYVYPILGSSQDGYSILGIPEYSNRGGQLISTPSQDHPGMDTVYQESPNTPTEGAAYMYVYPILGSSRDGYRILGIPEYWAAYVYPILGSSRDGYRILGIPEYWAACVYPILGSSQDGYSILGIPEYSDRGSSLCLPHPRIIPGWRILGSLCLPHPRIIPGWIQDTRNPRILGSLCLPHPRIIPGWIQDTRNPRILGSLCLPHPRIIPGWIQYTRNPRILRQREQLMSTPSQEHPRMDTVYQESPNTLTEGAAYVYPIPGSSRDGYSILGIPEYSDRGGSLCIPHPRIISGWIQYTRNPRIL